MTGTKTLCSTFKNTYQPTTFGGIIYESDFCTEYGGGEARESAIAGRIFNAWKFDQQCRRNAEIRDRNTKKEAIN